MKEKPDWIRLHKALAIEVEKGFANVQGNQYRFHEFLCLSFGQSPPAKITPEQRRHWHKIAEHFATYPELSLVQRRHLIADTRRFLRQLQASLEVAKSSSPPQPRLPQTKTITSQLSSNGCGLQLSLDKPLAQVPGIGTAKSKYLERLGLYYVRDLIYYYPRDYIDYARQVNIKNLVAGETVTIVGTVRRCNCFTSPKNKKLTIFELLIQDNTGQIRLNRFFAGNRYNNRGYQEKIKRQYPRGYVVAASGLVKQNKYGLTLENPEIEVLKSAGSTIESLKVGRVLPVYPLTEGVTADVVRQAVVNILPAANLIKDPLPSTLKKYYGLSKLKDAIANIHFPPTPTSLAHARRRLVFDEFFYLQLGFLQRRQQQKKKETQGIFNLKGELKDKLLQIIPFSLTNAQKRVIEEILTDLSSPTPMNRLVQGDVGSGKTIVAVFAILAAIQSGYQAALMAPTEVLAEQHFRKIVHWFNLLHLPVELLTGSTKTAKRRQIHQELQSGELPLLIGTHALIQSRVKFRQLGLVVIDEQHRFGVEQRAALLAKGKSPHVLTMTATPIPRSLALTLHGDLDISQIDELPPGRQTIQTQVVAGKQRSQVYDLIRREIAQGRQAYIIFPLVEESEKLDLRAAVEEHQRLSEKIFPQFKIGLLHGRMNAVEKEMALKDFRDRNTDIIVSTTVIEVGVDVPNATVMVIEHAERFGLSQLHQLRGRVGRGSHKSYCFLMSTTKNADAKQRLAVLEQSQDGFFISEMDMRFRGPGEVLGRRQSGLPDFALASLVEDKEVLNIARAAAEKIIFHSGGLENFPLIAQELATRYQRMLGATILT